MDCSSYTELQLCEACGISGSDIMFSSNVTPVQDMKLAYDMGAYINLDDYTHVEFIKKVCGVPKTICCRFNPGGVFKMADSEDKVQVMDELQDYEGVQLIPFSAVNGEGLDDIKQAIEEYVCC